MKKLFVLLSFLTIFLLIAGCQSETPVSPADQDDALDKGRTLKFTGEITERSDGFLNIVLNWDNYKNIETYAVIYHNYQKGKMIRAYYPNGSLTISNGLLKKNGDTCTVTIQALKRNHNGNLVVAFSGAQTFTYTGTSITFMDFAASTLTDGDESGIVDYHVQISDPPAAYYVYSIYKSWDDAFHYIPEAPNFTNPSSNPGSNLYGDFSRTGTAEDFITVTVYAYNSNAPYNIVAVANKVIPYQPSIGTVTGIGCDFQAASPVGTNLVVSWDAFPGAAYYWVYWLSLYDENVSLGFGTPENNYYTFYTPDLNEDPAVKFRIEAYNSTGTKIATGTAIINIPE